MTGRIKDETKFDTAIHASLALMSAAARAGDNCGLVVFGRKIRKYLPPKKGIEQLDAVLETLHAQSESGRSDAELHSVIQDLLDREVNKSIANHGGQISIVDIENGVLSIAMSGGCQGCASSQVTLRQGFEVMLRRVAPEIVEIVDTTDHLAGTKPFYKQRV